MLHKILGSNRQIEVREKRGKCDQLIEQQASWGQYKMCRGRKGGGVVKDERGKSGRESSRERESVNVEPNA